VPKLIKMWAVKVSKSIGIWLVEVPEFAPCGDWAECVLSAASVPKGQSHTGPHQFSWKPTWMASNTLGRSQAVMMPRGFSLGAPFSVISTASRRPPLRSCA